MAEPELVVEHRGHLWNLLMAAETLEHLIMCQYLYASFSLKTDPDEGLTAVQAEAVLTEPFTRTVAELFNLGYEVLLWLLTRFFTHTGETDEQLDALTGSAFALMSGVLAPLGRTLTRLPAGPGHPGRTAGPTFEMYYQMGNFIPSRGAAWAVVSERAATLAVRCADVASRDAAPASIGPVAETAAAVAARLASHVPPALRPT